MGFSADRVLTLEAASQSNQPATFWEQTADRLRDTPGVESVALAAWPLLSGNSWNGFVSVNGAPPGPIDAEFMQISPGWIGTMKMPLLSGRDFRPDDALPGTAIVNETFVRQILNGLSPIGVHIAKGSQSFQVVGVVHDTPYRDVHEDIRPVVFVPFHSAEQTRNATFVVRTRSADPMAMASTLRREVTRARVSNLRSQMEFVQAQTVRERLMSMLALFFAVVALVLAGIGLYGVLDYSVLQRRREIGIRIAIGAQSGEIARRVTSEVFRMVLAGAAAGVGLGMLSVRYIATLLYQVRPTDPAMLAVPSAIILGAAVLAALPAVFHAVRIDPVAMLRAD
jgi:predicted lysophospholipase L1 biosynthesis ABC-type transport system permease subunit